MPPMFLRVLPFALGFFLVANGVFLSAGGASLRFTDLIALVVAALFGMKAFGRANWSAVGVGVALAFMPVAWAGLSVLGIADRATLAQGARWVFALPWALVLVAVAHEEPGRTRFVKGIALGCAFNALVIVAQQYGFDGPLARLGFSSFGERIVWVGQQVRMPGLHGSPSASSAVLSLIAPATLWLYLKDRVSLWWPLVGYASAGVGLHLTASRSPLLMLGISTGLALLITLSRRRALGLWAIAIMVGLPLLIVVGPPGGWVRWTDIGDTTVNASNRLHTNVSTMELSLQQPLGRGVEGGQRALFEETGYVATHNAWLQASLVYGIPMALAILVAFASAIFRLRYGWKSEAFWPGLLAFHLSGIFFFEEHLTNPTFVILTMWLAVLAVIPVRASPRPAQSTRVS
jgi:hypothetical protein